MSNKRGIDSSHISHRSPAASLLATGNGSPSDGASSPFALSLSLSTIENLQRHAAQQRRAMCTSRSRPTSPSKSKSSRTRNSSPNKDNGSVRSGQDGFKLACFGVSDGGRGTELPPSLLEFVNTTIKQDVQETPRARRIAGKALAVARMSETNGARLLRAHLLETPAIETDDPDDGVPGIAVSSNSDLYEQWLPEPLDEMVKQWFLKLEAPRPDETMGICGKPSRALASQSCSVS
jgi:hypothetical protein